MEKREVNNILMQMTYHTFLIVSHSHSRFLSAIVKHFEWQRISKSALSINIWIYNTVQNQYNMELDIMTQFSILFCTTANEQTSGKKYWKINMRIWKI